jgi:hypothetical protein
MCIRSFFNNENVIKRRITKKRKLKTRKPWILRYKKKLDTNLTLVKKFWVFS